MLMWIGIPLHGARLIRYLFQLMKRTNIGVLPNFILCLERSHFMIPSTHMTMTIAIGMFGLGIIYRSSFLLCQERANIFQKNGIDPSTYTIMFRLADNVPKQGAYMVIVVCGFVYFYIGWHMGCRWM